jgi:hypothetical protein
MLSNNVLEILPLLMPKTLIDSFVFVWGCEQCTTATDQLTRSIYCYLKDLDRVHLACRGLPYGHMDQTLFIDDEPSKAL